MMSNTLNLQKNKYSTLQDFKIMNLLDKTRISSKWTDDVIIYDFVFDTLNGCRKSGEYYHIMIWLRGKYKKNWAMSMS